METNDMLGGFRGLALQAHSRGKMTDRQIEVALELIERASQAIGIAQQFDREEDLWGVFEGSIIAGWTGGLYGVWGNKDVEGVVRAILAACESQAERARAARVVGVDASAHPSTWGAVWDMSHKQEFYHHMMVEATSHTLTALTLLYLDMATRQKGDTENDRQYTDAKNALNVTEVIFGFICEFAPPQMAFRASCELYRLTMDAVDGFEAGEIPAASLASNIIATRARMLFVSLDGGL